MKYLALWPVFDAQEVAHYRYRAATLIDCHQRAVLVIGGGPVAARKAQSILRAALQRRA